MTREIKSANPKHGQKKSANDRLLTKSDQIQILMPKIARWRLKNKCWAQICDYLRKERVDVSEAQIRQYWSRFRNGRTPEEILIDECQNMLKKSEVMQRQQLEEEFDKKFSISSQISNNEIYNLTRLLNQERQKAKRLEEENLRQKQEMQHLKANLNHVGEAIYTCRRTNEMLEREIRDCKVKIKEKEAVAIKLLKISMIPFVWRIESIRVKDSKERQGFREKVKQAQAPHVGEMPVLDMMVNRYRAQLNENEKYLIERNIEIGNLNNDVATLKCEMDILKNDIMRTRISATLVEAALEKKKNYVRRIKKTYQQERDKILSWCRVAYRALFLGEKRYIDMAKVSAPPMVLNYHNNWVSPSNPLRSWGGILNAGDN